MKRANTLSLLAVTAFLVAAPVVALAGPVVSGPFTLAGYANFDLTKGTSTWQAAPEPLAAVTVYDNGNAPIGAVTSTDLFSVWGDAVTTTQTGTLDEIGFTLFNAGGGPLLTANVHIHFYDAVTLNPIGGLTGSLNFGSGLPVGAYTIASGTGLSALGINLPTTNILMTQQIVGLTGTSTTLGAILMNPPPAVGVGSPAMFIGSSTFGPTGFYNLGGIDEADPGYHIGVLEPTPTQSKTWGAVKGDYRGR